MGDCLEIRTLSDAAGAEIVGFDFTRAPDANATAQWHSALDTHQLLLFRGAAIDAETQLAFVETLGPALIENDTGRAYQFVSNTHEEGILGDESFAFHSDHAFMDEPIDVICLYGLEVPAAGTQTRFANGVRAAAALPQELRERIRDRRARHIIDPGAPSGRIPLRGPRLSDSLPHAYHPILWEHPETGESILYVSEQQTDRIESVVGESDEEADKALIEALFAHLYSPRFIYVHEWQPGDLVIWDNRALQHARSAIPAGTSRTLRRVSVGGTSVYEFFRDSL